MNHRWIFGLLGAGALCVIGLRAVASTDPVAASSGTASAESIPSVVTLEAGTTDDEVRVRLRRFDQPQPLRELGTIRMTPSSAWRGALYQNAGRSAVLVVGATLPLSSTSYDSALFLVENGTSRTLVTGLAHASGPLVTERGVVLVQRGRDGQEPSFPATGGQALAERVDSLEISAVDLSTGVTRSVWRGEGPLAYLATALHDNRVLIYHMAPEGAYLRTLDTETRETTTVMGPMPALARDFSYDKLRNEVTFVRAERVGSETYEIVTVALSNGASRVRLRSPNEHLMPRVLRDGEIAFSSANDQGLSLLRASDTEGHSLAPLGAGSDAVVAEDGRGAWLAVRHLDPQTRLDSFAIVHRGTRQQFTFSDANAPVELVGFWQGGSL
ncbi:MAG: hypothetical protein Q8Q09_17710 [Deltaproteobacteria bacterium]|nr:hypothetical protein [Deltaproteobacteria bacterium]